MNDIDRYLDQACRQITGPDSLRAHLRNELKEHLEEAIDALVAEGMSRGDATAKAIDRPSHSCANMPISALSRIATIAVCGVDSPIGAATSVASVAAPSVRLHPARNPGPGRR